MLYRQTNRRRRLYNNVINSNIDDRRKRRHRRPTLKNAIRLACYTDRPTLSTRILLTGERNSKRPGLRSVTNCRFFWKRARACNCSAFIAEYRGHSLFLLADQGRQQPIRNDHNDVPSVDTVSKNRCWVVPFATVQFPASSYKNSEDLRVLRNSPVRLFFLTRKIVFFN